MQRRRCVTVVNGVDIGEQADNVSPLIDPPGSGTWNAETRKVDQLEITPPSPWSKIGSLISESNLYSAFG